MKWIRRYLFTRDVALRLFARSDMTMREVWPYARDLVREYLANEKIEFGDPEYDWTREGAHTVADEEMSYWGD